MGRLFPFLQLTAVVLIVSFFGVWGAVPAGLVTAPLLIVILCPLLAASAVWPLHALRRAFLDGWGNDPLRRASPESALIWRFLERMAPIAGILGAGTFLVLALSGLADLGRSGDASAPGQHAAALAGLCGGESAGAFLLFRVVRQTVDLLQDRGGTRIPREMSDAAVARFSLSPREREVAGLLTEGLRYDEIAARLFISTTTVKTHVHHLYEKTDTRNRMELANRLRA
jgi:DNA-binding CsgD family transcriptional regulator